MGVGTATAKSMVLNLVAVNLIGMLGSQVSGAPTPAPRSRRGRWPRIGAEAEEAPGELEPAKPEIASAGVAFKPEPSEAEGEEFRFHTGVAHAWKVPAAVEFVDVRKSFGSNHVLRA